MMNNFISLMKTIKSINLMPNEKTMQYNSSSKDEIESKLN